MEKKGHLKMIGVSEETHKKLESLGKKGESFEGIIIKLIDKYKNKSK